MLRNAFRRERRERPATFRLALLGIALLSVGGILAVGHSILLAQLVAGLALLPLSLATYFRLLPSSPWSDGRSDGGGPGGEGDDRGGRGPSGGLDAETDWDRFERQFRAYIDDRELVQP